MGRCKERLNLLDKINVGSHYQNLNKIRYVISYIKYEDDITRTDINLSKCSHLLLFVQRA